MQHGIFLAFDYGTKKIGVAIGNSITNKATPVGIIYNVDKQINWQLILKYINEYKPHSIIIGNPLNMDDSKSRLSELANVFAQELKQKVHANIYMHDERLTSFEARGLLIQEQIKRKCKIHNNIDAVAAAILLDSFFAMNKFL